MKRSKRLFLLLLVLALVLGATWAATLLNPENEEEETSCTTIFTVDADDVTAISWDYSEQLSFVKEDGQWVYEEDPDFPLDESYLEAMLDSVKEIQSSRTIEAVEDWDQYTLEVPICEITVTAGDDTQTIRIGEETSLGGERYLSIGDGNAYLVDAQILDAFSYGLYDVLAYESIPSMSEVTAMEHLSKDSYRIDLKENSGLAYTDDYVWFIGETPLDTELTQTLMRYVTNLSWSECVSYHAEDLSKYGLEDPAAAITMHYLETVKAATNETDDDGNTVYETRQDAKTFTLEIGAKADSGYYARIQDSSMVYTISDGIAEALLYTTEQELLPDEVLLMDWEEVTSMDITLDGETYQITKDTKTVSDDEGNETEQTVYLLKGKEVDAEDITGALDDLDSSGYATGLTPERGEEIRFVFHRDHETFPEVELAFYQYNSASCMVTLNGAATVFTDRQSVVDLVEAVNALVLG